MNMQALLLRDVKRFAEYSVRPELQQAARDELVRRMTQHDYAEPRTSRQPAC